MIRVIVKLLLAGLALVAVIDIPSAHAALLFVSGTGVDTGTCQASAPCASIGFAASLSAFDGTEIACIGDGEVVGGTISQSVTVDCNGTMADSDHLIISGPGITVVLRNLTMFEATVTVQSGNLVMDNVHIRSSTTALLVQPNAPSKVVVKNCIFDANGTGVVLDPAAGGSIMATFDRVTITGNTGGGIKINTASGPVTTDITDSEISNNGGNGINAVAGANQDIVSIEHSVIARNGAAGVQANGVNAGVLLSRTLLDQNVAGALSVVGGGNMFTYGDNRIVGGAGSGFNHAAGLQ